MPPVHIFRCRKGASDMSKRLRHRVFVDRVVQGALIRHMMRCWLISYVLFGGLTFVGWMFIHPGLGAFVGPEAFMVEILPMAVVGLGAAAIVLPLYLWGLVKVSHRFAGPIVRLKRVMRVAADGGPLDPIHFRNDDFWQELATSYNDLLIRVHSKMTTRASVARPAESGRPLPSTGPLPLSTSAENWELRGGLDMAYPATLESSQD
jgi:hypothetical protein